MSRFFGDTIQIRNECGVNKVKLMVKKSHYAGLIYTLAALFLGIIVGLAFQHFLPTGMSDAISRLDMKKYKS